MYHCIQESRNRRAPKSKHVLQQNYYKHSHSHADSLKEAMQLKRIFLPLFSINGRGFCGLKMNLDLLFKERLVCAVCSMNLQQNQSNVARRASSDSVFVVLV